MTDLRTLAQAVVDAEAARPATVREYHDAVEAAEAALGRALGLSSLDADGARTILAALDAADARGYARAMGEVDAMASRRVRTTSPGSDEHHALVSVADWARERAAAAEKERVE